MSAGFYRSGYSAASAVLGLSGRISASSTNSPTTSKSLGRFLGMLVPALAFLDSSRENRGTLLGATIAVTVGIIDDFRGLPWYGKLAGQLAAADGPA